MARSEPLPAPWHLVESPNVLHIVIDEAALAALASHQPNPLDFHKNMRQLLWLTAPPRGEKKWEVNGWMLLVDIGWITNDGEFFLPVVYKALDKFERWCKDRTDRGDLKVLNGKAVAKLVSGTYKSHGVPSSVYLRVWTKAEPTYEQQIRSLESAVMADALDRIDQPSPFEAAAARAAQASAESDAFSRAQLALARETHGRQLACAQSASEQRIADFSNAHQQQLAAVQQSSKQQLAAVQQSVAVPGATVLQCGLNWCMCSRGLNCPYKHEYEDQMMVGRSLVYTRNTSYVYTTRHAARAYSCSREVRPGANFGLAPTEPTPRGASRTYRVTVHVVYRIHEDDLRDPVYYLLYSINIIVSRGAQRSIQ